MVVVRPPDETYMLPPGLQEESFDTDARLGRVNLLSILFNTVSAVNREEETYRGADPGSFRTGYLRSTGPGGYFLGGDWRITIHNR
jgi:hypothetical protein